MLWFLISLGEAQKVLLRDVQALTFYEGRMTTGRRSSPVPQLTQISGNAPRSSRPRVVQCVNVGFDGHDVQWRCSAELDSKVAFGETTVTCEGYNYPEDPYVLQGSCGLEYDLHRTSSWSSYSSNYQTYYQPSWFWGLIVSIFSFTLRFFVYLLILYAIYLVFVPRSVRFNIWPQYTQPHYSPWNPFGWNPYSWNPYGWNSFGWNPYYWNWQPYTTRFYYDEPSYRQETTRTATGFGSTRRRAHDGGFSSGGSSNTRSSSATGGTRRR
ncbi:store-operated calcium entry-associated regulatory factor precursor [Gorgonomyces haynaldii]|nr:store-operated calcium entry-associated regulatory factor precursor [Gorgonomyces haynaldii]